MLSIIIPTKDRPAILDQTIVHLIGAIEGLDAEVLIINDSKTQAVAYPMHPQIKVHFSGRSSAAVSRNLGAQHAKGDVLLFLDDDILIDSACLKSLYHKVQSSDNTVCLPNWIYPDRLNSQLSGSSFGRFVIRYNYNNLKGYIGAATKWNNEQAFEHNGVASYCLMLKKNLFVTIKGYSEGFTFAGFEDHDISKKLKQHGVKILIEPKLIVLHNEEDKLQVPKWLERLEKGAVTRRQAVKIGYNELELKYSSVKSFLFRTFYVRRGFLIGLLNGVPNLRLFDPVYILIFKLLVGAHIYKGYNQQP
ncbi:MAG: glycosyltransferase family 2 protein [Bacteroidia bacterium]